ncbi:MAG: formate dehydrogenase subunit gamma [Gallionellales bacterium CG_4_10_14_3_um_filter_54_96]|nr:MAG: formate dehydrogenase subunit gamma [Gallionellales bacterium CG03_land_8_20_14_0_80_55_15]PIX05419.1 MAG: formate dehydrogenase subunit gamma [Gallionellales bacterium CG_4_8_14_3_um_filter_54_18]PIY04755.1 MAG: formate dehydrogenase subunit gamma [Gallionellales bacterium CG_4_10_14_3_um_filter_54_96]PJC05270.1 MAG: formate dehydrogenase subunit gamma [Gallionellales bacterium CG_4_9_14_0_8_um_filter_55_61]
MIATLDTIFTRHREQAGALLPILHDIQDALGYVPEEAVPLIAGQLNLSRAEVHGVISYYPHFRQTREAGHVVHLCCAEACQANGSEALAAHAAATLQGAKVTVKPVYCLGLCASGPAMQIDETRLVARVTTEKFDALMNELGARA